MGPENYNVKKATGIIVGILLCAIWFFGIFCLEGTLFPHNPVNLQNSLVAWIYVGPVPLLVMIGNFLFTMICPQEDVRRNLLDLRGMVTGFLVWTVLLGILLYAGIGGEGFGLITTTGGLLFMLILVKIFREKCS